MNLKLKYIRTVHYSLFILFFLFTIQNAKAQTQTQTICYGDVKNYSVDLTDGTTGTLGSTYAWSVLQPSFVGTITGKVNSVITNANAIVLNWGTTVSGTYTLRVVETNNGCIGSPVDLTVVIQSLPAAPTVAAVTTPICSGTDAQFIITGTAGLQVSYAINLGVTQTTTLDSLGKSSITVSGASSDQILVISQVTDNGTSCSRIITGVNATVTVKPLPVTSTISFD